MVEPAAVVPAQIDAGLRQNAFVRREPSKTQRCGQQCNIIRNRTFRRPQTCRRSTEPLMHERLRARELLTGVVWKMHGDRNVTVVDAAVDQDRQNRMIEGRRRYLDRALLLHPAVFRNNGANRLFDDLPQPVFVAFGEIPSLFDEVLRSTVVVKPGERPPDLYVADILIGERMVPGRIAAALVQLEYVRHDLLEEVADVVAELRGRDEVVLLGGILREVI